MAKSVPSPGLPAASHGQSHDPPYLPPWASRASFGLEAGPVQQLCKYTHPSALILPSRWLSKIPISANSFYFK